MQSGILYEKQVVWDLIVLKIRWPGGEEKCNTNCKIYTSSIGHHYMVIPVSQYICFHFVQTEKSSGDKCARLDFQPGLSSSDYMLDLY